MSTDSRNRDPMSLPGGASVRIREMRITDIPAGLALCRASGWNQTGRDWQHFLIAAPRGALVAEQDGRVVGTVATLPYGPFTWISMVLVDPVVRGRGIGMALLHRGLALVPGDVVARLDATPAGEVLYRRLGFTREIALARWFADHTAPPAPLVPGVRPLEAADWPGVREMDLRAFGASRARLLARLAREAPEYAWIADGQGGMLRGFVFGRHGHVRDHVGPLVAESAGIAQALLAACRQSHPDRPLFIDAPDDQREWSNALSASGFAIERPFLRMYRGQLTSPGQRALVFAIAGPEFG